jgi:hypothetical protein
MFTPRTATLLSTMLASGMVPCAMAQSSISFGPISVPGTSVVFDPDGVLTAASLAGLMGGDGNHSPMPAVQAMSFSPGTGQVFNFSASGTVSFNYNIASDTVGPDGAAGNSDIASLGSVSGWLAPVVFPLVGLFTDGSPAVQEANSLPSSFQISIGGIAVTPVYAGLAPGYTGLYQFNITIPPGISSGTEPLTFTIDGHEGAQVLNLATTP